MPRFLSPEWLDLLAEAAASAPPTGDGSTGPFAIRHRVTGGPCGDVDYVVRVDGGRFSVHAPGEVGADPDVEVVQDYATAAAISQGRLSPSVAFAGGRLKLGGSVGLVARHQDVFARMSGLLAQVRDETTY